MDCELLALRHIVTSQVEHSSVLNYCMALEKEGYRVTCLPVDREGLLNLADLEAAIAEETSVVSLMWANNETGVLFPVERIAEICRSRGVLYHCDAVQAAGKVAIDVRKIPADYLSLTGHKFHAPKGIGALYVRPKSPFSPLVYGGHQERNRRGGTESVPLIVGMGKAAHLARKFLPDYEKKVRPLRDELEEDILSSIPKPRSQRGAQLPACPLHARVSLWHRHFSFLVSLPTSKDRGVVWRLPPQFHTLGLRLHQESFR